VFRCPNCKQRTISAWAKLSASAWKPVICPECGGKSIPAWWGVIPASLAFPLALFLPFTIVPATPERIWWLLGAGLALAIVAFPAVFLITAPLLAQGSRAARWEFWSWLALAAVIVVLGVVKVLDPTAFEGASFPPVVEHGVARRGTHMGDPADQEKLKAALTRAGVPYTLEMRDGKEFVMWSQDRHAAAEKIQREILSGPFPNGRNIHFGDAATEKEFKDWLTKQGVAYRIENMHGRDFVVWDGPPELWKKFLEEHPGCPKTAMETRPTPPCG
jgi:hypothetical protein